jgi:hypothetical protein
MGFAVVGLLSGSSELSSNTDQNCGARVRDLPRQNGRSHIPIKRGGVQTSTLPKHQERINSGLRLASPRLNCFLVSFRGEFFGLLGAD